MKYYICETVFDEVRNRTAGSKAREDINLIVEQMGFKPIVVEYDYVLRKNKGFLYALKKLTEEWKSALSKINNGDVVLIQYPLNHHPLFVGNEIDKLHARGGKLIIFIHDIDSLRMSYKGVIQCLKFAKVKIEDESILKRGDAVISHNKKMTEILISKFSLNTNILVNLKIFDYLVGTKYADVKFNDNVCDESIVIAGTFRRGKAGYVYNLPRNINFNLYGIGYEDKGIENIKYHGAFLPEELIKVMKGKFGLVWDGDSTETCEGLSGNYMRYNNTHKTSLYLAAGIPVIVWKQAAIADFILENRCGLTINNIDEITQLFDKLEENDYNILYNNAIKISDDLKSGEFTRVAINEALLRVKK